MGDTASVSEPQLSSDQSPQGTDDIGNPLRCCDEHDTYSPDCGRGTAVVGGDLAADVAYGARSQGRRHGW